MKDKQRTCADRAKIQLVLKKHHRNKRLDPTMSMAIRLLELASVILRLLPSAPGIGFAPRLDPIPEPPPESAPVPTSAVRRVYKTPPSWPKLMRDLERPVAHDEALEHVRMRLPSHLKAWLDYIEEKGEWSVLRPFAFSGATDETVSAGVLVMARDWQDAKDAKDTKVTTERDGKGVGSAAAPGVGDAGGDDDDTTRPSGPK